MEASTAASPKPPAAPAKAGPLVPGTGKVGIPVEKHASGKAAVAISNTAKKTIASSVSNTKVKKGTAKTVAGSSQQKTSAHMTEFAERLDKMESLLSKVIEALPQATANSSLSPANMATATGSGEQDMSTRGAYYPTAPHADMNMPDNSPTGQLDMYMIDHDDDTASGFDHAEQIPQSQVEQFEIPTIAAKFAMPTDIGDPIDEEVAKSTTYLMTHQLELKVLEDVVGKYPSPNNCQLIDVPKVNPPIWDFLPPATKSRDLKLQRVQKSLTKGLNAFTRSLSAGRMSDTQQDALALICNANFELNCLRKELIKPDINSRFAHLCKPSLPATRLLFGDDLGKQVKDLKDQQLAAAGVMKSQGRARPIAAYQRSLSRPYPQRGRGFQHAAYNRPVAGSTAGPFLGQNYNRRGRQPPPHTQTLSSSSQATQQTAQRGGHSHRRK